MRWLEFFSWLAVTVGAFIVVGAMFLSFGDFTMLQVLALEAVGGCIVFLGVQGVGLASRLRLENTLKKFKEGLR